MGGEPIDGVNGSFGASLWDEDLVAAVVVHGWSDVPVRGAMLGPGLTSCEFLVSNDFGAKRPKGGSIVVERPVELGLGR